MYCIDYPEKKDYFVTKNHLGFNDLPVAKILAYSPMFLHQNGLPVRLKKFRSRLEKSLLFRVTLYAPHIRSIQGALTLETTSRK